MFSAHPLEAIELLRQETQPDLTLYLSHSIFFGVSIWEIWMQCDEKAWGLFDWQKVSQTTTSTVKVQKVWFQCSSSSGLNWILISKMPFSVIWIDLSVFVNVLSLPHICLASAFPQEDLLLVHYKEKDVCLCWAPLWCALPLLSATINEIHLRSRARQINPIRFCHSLCVSFSDILSSSLLLRSLSLFVLLNLSPPFLFISASFYTLFATP